MLRTLLSLGLVLVGCGPEPEYHTFTYRGLEFYSEHALDETHIKLGVDKVIALLDQHDLVRPSAFDHVFRGTKIRVHDVAYIYVLNQGVLGYTQGNRVDIVRGGTFLLHELLHVYETQANPFSFFHPDWEAKGWYALAGEYTNFASGKDLL